MLLTLRTCRLAPVCFNRLPIMFLHAPVVTLVAQRPDRCRLNDPPPVAPDSAADPHGNSLEWGKWSINYQLNTVYPIAQPGFTTTGHNRPALSLL